MIMDKQTYKPEDTSDDSETWQINYTYWPSPGSKESLENPTSGQIPKEEVKKDMMRLYQVYIVDTKKNIVLHTPTIIAKSEDKAKMKAVRLGDVDVENEYIEIFVQVVGEWESKKPKEVKIVKE